MKVRMYSCCSGTCFLKPASMSRPLAFQPRKAVTAANSSRITGRYPKTILSAKRSKEFMRTPSLLRLVGVHALLADHHVAGGLRRDDGGQRWRLASGVGVGAQDERRGAVGAHEHRAVAADQ